MNLSEHITYKEATHSFTAKRLGIDNIPKEEHIWNMIILASDLFEPLREWVGGAIRINSFYRSEALNTAIGGLSRSQHCNGQAIDIDDCFRHKTNAEMFHYIKDHLDFDQLIWEFGDDNNPDWVHVSYVGKLNNRKNVLKAYKKNGKTLYEKI
jgi:zinc D-Ala-D-Ala carboxypeptidase